MKSTTAKAFALLCAMMLTALLPAAARHTLFSSGKTDYTIVVPEGAAPTLRNAAQELQKYLREAGGVDMPVETKACSGGGKHLFVGFNANGKAVVEGKRALGEKDSYTYSSRGSSIYFYGNSPRSAMYAVFSFLEDWLGVRWFAHDLTRVPQVREYSFTKLKKTSTAAIAMRLILYKECEDTRWCAHNKVNGNHVEEEWGGFDEFSGIHSSTTYMPASEYFDSHPEYYALRNGQRTRDGQLCLTNPDVRRILTQKLLATIERNPAPMIYDMSQADNRNYCTCPECEALAAKYGAQSGVWIWFVNQVAREVKKHFPNKFVDTFAYQYTRTPPKGIVPDSNVVIRLCSIECCFTHSLEGCSSELNKKFLEDIRTWAKIAPHIYIWDYVVAYSQYAAPFPNLKVLAPNIATFQKYNSIGVFEEAQYQTLHGELSELRAYMLSKLLWDPTIPADSLAREFIDAYYGKAAPAVWKYCQIMENLVTPDTHMGIYPDVHNGIYSDSFIAEAMKLLQSGMAQCADTATLRRVERVWTAPAFLHVFRAPDRAKADGTLARFVAIAKRDKMRMSEGASLEQYLAKYGLAN